MFDRLFHGFKCLSNTGFGNLPDQYEPVFKPCSEPTEFCCIDGLNQSVLESCWLPIFISYSDPNATLGLKTPLLIQGQITFCYVSGSLERVWVGPHYNSLQAIKERKRDILEWGLCPFSNIHLLLFLLFFSSLIASFLLDCDIAWGAEEKLNDSWPVNPNLNIDHSLV